MDEREEARDEAHDQPQGQPPGESSEEPESEAAGPPPEGAAEPQTEPQPSEQAEEAAPEAPAEGPQPEAPPPEPERPAPEEPAAPAPAPPQPGAPGPSFKDKVGGLFQQLAGDWRAFRSSTSLSFALRGLERDRRAREAEFHAALIALGAAAEEASVETHLAPAAPVAAARQSLAEAENILEGKASALQEAEEKLAAEKAKHSEIITALEEEHRRLVAEQRSADAAVREIESRLSATEANIRRLESQIARAQQAPPAEGTQAPGPSVDSLREQLTPLQAARERSQGELPAAQERQAQARQAAEAKAAELQEARNTWQGLQQELSAVVSEAKAARDAAQGDVDAKKKTLADAHHEFGEAILAEGSSPHQIGEAASKAQGLQTAIRDLQAATAEKRAQRDELKAGSRRFLITAGVALAVVVVIVVLLIVLL